MNQINPNTPEPTSFLTRNQVVTELTAQQTRDRQKYFKIAMCCAVVIGVALLVANLAIFIPALQALLLPASTLIYPSWYGTTGGMPPSPTNEYIFSPTYRFGNYFVLAKNRSLVNAYMLALTVGNLIVPVSVAFAVFGIIQLVKIYKIYKLNAAINDANANLTADQRVNKKRLTNILKRSDIDSLNRFIPEMDFNQLKIARNVLGDRTFRTLLMNNPNATKKRHQVWKTLLSLKDPANTNAFLNKLDSLNTAGNLQSYPKLKSMILNEVQQVKNLSLRILAARTLSQRMPNEMNKEQAEDEHHVTLTLQEERLQARISVPSNILTQNSDFFASALSAEAMEWGKNLDEPLRVDSIEVFKKTIRLVNPKNRNHIPNEMRLGKILTCAHKYFDRFADTLQSVLTNRELRSFARQNPSLNVYLQQRGI